LRRLPRSLFGQLAALQGRGARVPRCELFPRAGPRAALWIVGARPGDRHRADVRRGVSTLHRVLDRAPRYAGARIASVCAAGFATRNWRVPLRAETRRRHGARSPHAALPPAERFEARDRTADQHVLFRREPSERRRRLSPGSARFGWTV